MSVITPRTRGKHLVRFVTRLDRENHETLHAYARFLSEPPEYVLNELIDRVLARDKDFVKWRTEHPDSCVPRPAKHRARRSSRAASPNTEDGWPESSVATRTPAAPATRA